jgi:hypothetical protein
MKWISMPKIEGLSLELDGRPVFGTNGTERSWNPDGPQPLREGGRRSCRPQTTQIKIKVGEIEAPILQC